MASARPHSMRRFLTTEVAWPVKFFPGRNAASGQSCSEVYASEDGDVKLREVEIKLDYRQARLGALV
eukprot:5584522-Alexandrium_andersonii.AAC.1